MKKIRLFSVLFAVCMVFMLGGCGSSGDDVLMEKMTENARAIVRMEYPQYSMNLFAVFTQTAEDPGLFENADELAYWKFIFSDYDN